MRYAARIRSTPAQITANSAQQRARVQQREARKETLLGAEAPPIIVTIPPIDTKTPKRLPGRAQRLSPASYPTATRASPPSSTPDQHQGRDPLKNEDPKQAGRSQTSPSSGDALPAKICACLPPFAVDPPPRVEDGASSHSSLRPSSETQSKSAQPRINARSGGIETEILDIFQDQEGESTHCTGQRQGPKPPPDHTTFSNKITSHQSPTQAKYSAARKKFHYASPPSDVSLHDHWRYTHSLAQCKRQTPNQTRTNANREVTPRNPGPQETNPIKIESSLAEATRCSQDRASNSCSPTEPEAPEPPDRA
ncbi:unnamed protein product [Diplocarpon coronariae]